MGKKPSFFDRLTGKSESNEYETDLISKKIKNISLDESDESEMFPEPRQIKEKNDKSWPPETEGQLTIDVYQNPSEIIIKSTIAGVKPEDLDVTITNDMVTIKGKREKDDEVSGEDYYYQECYWGSFSRSVILPVDIDSDNSEASLKNGILTIHLPKLEKIKTKKIKIKTI